MQPKGLIRHREEGNGRNIQQPTFLTGQKITELAVKCKSGKSDYV